MLPSTRVFNGLFTEYVPWLPHIEETGKVNIAGIGDKRASFTAIEDVAGM